MSPERGKKYGCWGPGEIFTGLGIKTQQGDGNAAGVVKIRVANNLSTCKT